MPDQQITDEGGDLRRWRTELPNIIDDLGLDVFERALYGHYKRVCGANGGTCYESTRTTAHKIPGMSAGQVSIVRRRLVERGLITEDIQHTIHIKIIDVWELNFAYYSVKDRPTITGWTIAQLQKWINESVYHLNTPEDEDEDCLPPKQDVYEVNSKDKKCLPHKTKKEPSSKKELIEEETDSLTGSDEPPEESLSEKSTKQQAAQAMFSAVAEVCKIDWRVCTKEQRGALNQTEKFLREKASAEPDDLPHFGRWWYAHDWRGKKGEDPEPHQVREEWGRCMNWRKSNTPIGEPGEKPPRDLLEVWWSEQRRGKQAPLQLFQNWLHGSRAISRENGRLTLMVPQANGRAQLEDPKVLAEVLASLPGIERLEIVEQ